VTAVADRVSGEGDAALVDGSALALTTLLVEPSAGQAVGDPEQDTLLFVPEGEATLTLAGGVAHRLGPGGAAALVEAGTAGTVSTETATSVILATVGEGGIDLHAPMGAAEVVTALEAVEAGQATGSRSFQVLYGPHNGCVRATLFVGYIPPGKAPWHYHLYDEIVWVLRGSGRLHLRDRAPEELRAGCAFRLRPREVHIVENLSADGELAVLGLFTPAGSPSAAYLEPGVLAEYRIG
jgi:quercetin dioxygenase-like cupin family protein